MKKAAMATLTSGPAMEIIPFPFWCQFSPSSGNFAIGRFSSLCRSLMRCAYFNIPTFSFLTFAIL